MKKILSLVLVFILVASICVSAFAAPVIKKVKPAEISDIDKQIDFIFENLADLSLDSADGLWTYAITDLDHNGNLELTAAICKTPEYKTYARIFEVTPERDAFMDCDMSVKEGEPFVDILQDSADSYYDRASDTWYYVFAENYNSSNTENYSVKCSVSLKDGYVTPTPYAQQHTTIENGQTVVAFEDLNGNPITPEEYNNAGNAAFKDFEKSSVNFGWFQLKDARTASTLTESYQVFVGDKNANQTVSAKKAEMNNITIVPAPVDTSFLMITKNPTSEYVTTGSTATFIAKANNATYMYWTFVAPSGYECTPQDFELQFIQCKVNGANGTTLTIQNVNESMSGWGAYCTFSANGQTARSTTAYLSVAAAPTPYPVPTYQPIAQSIGGYVSDFLMSSVTIYLNNGTSVQVLKDICNVSGVLASGCYCTCYYSGDYPTSGNIYRVDVAGQTHTDPVYPVYPDPYVNPNVVINNINTLYSNGFLTDDQLSALALGANSKEEIVARANQMYSMGLLTDDQLTYIATSMVF